MCLEVKMFMKMSQFFGGLFIYYGIFASMGVMGQVQSPCPRIFEYEKDLNGAKVDVISNEETVELEVQLSLGNHINFQKKPLFDDRPKPPIPPIDHTRPRTNQYEPIPIRSEPSSSEECGVPLVANLLVVKGNSVVPGAFPWLAAMFVRTGTGVEYICCGSLISHKHIITAAHCLTKEKGVYKPEDVNFILGKHNLDDILSFDKNEISVKARNYKIHKEYVFGTADADIAVVILAHDVPYTHYIRPICLWSESDDLEYIVGKKGTVVGWGKTEPGNTLRIKEPKLVTGTIVSQEDCLRSNIIFRRITSHRSFCAGDRDNSGPCNGDSGSGFIMNRNGAWALRGIVSASVRDN